MVKDQNGNWFEWARYKTILGMEDVRNKFNKMGVKHYSEELGL